MAEILNFKSYLSTNDKWQIVKIYYEKRYKIKFKKKISDSQIEELFQKIGKFDSEINQHFNKKPGLKEKFFSMEVSSVHGKDSNKT